LLRIVLTAITAPRLIMHLLKTAPCTGSPELPKFDAVLRESLSTTLNIDLGDDRWTMQASLHVRWGGLVVRGVVSLALASGASTDRGARYNLYYILACVMLSIVASLISMSAWCQSARLSRQSLHLHLLQPFNLWDKQLCCEVQADQLFDAAVDDVERARYLASREPRSGD